MDGDDEREEKETLQVRFSDRNKDNPRSENLLSKMFAFMERANEKDSLSFAKAMANNEKHEYKNSIITFLDDLEKLNAFKEVTRPKDINLIGSR